MFSAPKLNYFSAENYSLCLSFVDTAISLHFNASTCVTCIIYMSFLGLVARMKSLCMYCSNATVVTSGYFSLRQNLLSRNKKTEHDYNLKHYMLLDTKRGRKSQL